MDRSLDEIVQERQQSAPRNRRAGGGRRPERGSRRPERSEYPRDGVRKSTRDDYSKIDSDWVHDKFQSDDRSGSYRGHRGGQYSPEPYREREVIGSRKLRVENVHYDLTEDDLDGLFNRIGPVESLKLSYDRAGRSNGICYVIYEDARDAKDAVREFDGANANGQPIRLVPMPEDSRPRGRAAYDASRPPRSLAERISFAPGAARSRSESPIRHSDVSGPPPANVDRYVPGGSDREDFRPRGGRREQGRRPGARRERGERGGRGRERGGEKLSKDGRPRKTQEELDAEMEDYWTKSGAANGDANGGEQAAGGGGDIDMVDEEIL